MSTEDVSTTVTDPAAVPTPALTPIASSEPDAVSVPSAVAVPAAMTPLDLKKSPLLSPLLKNLKKRPSSGCETQHYAEMRAQTMKALGTQQIQTRLDRTQGRDMWQAWAGGGTFAAAEFKGEWGTEIGAIRRARNTRALPMPQQDGPVAQEQRFPAAGRFPSAGGSTEAVAEVMARRYHQKHAESGWWLWLKRIAVVGIVLVAAFGAGALWFADRAAGRQTPRPVIPPQAFDLPADAHVAPVRVAPARVEPDAAVEPHGAGREPTRGSHRHEPERPAERPTEQQ